VKRTTVNLSLGVLVGFLAAMPAAAQNQPVSSEKPATIQYMRPYDQKGINVFEPSKFDNKVEYKGFKIDWGAAFSQSLQSLKHSNEVTDPKLGLIKMGPGFNLAAANLALDVQLADGIRLNLTTYLSSRHHNETWVKAGEVVIDKLPIENDLFNAIMSFSRIRVGHMEVNYGDAHFRRSDNGQAMYNPFIGNLLLESFTTEIAAEGYMFLGPVTVMGGLTGGEIKGNVLTPERRSAALLGKLAYDKSFTPKRRARLSASFYSNSKSPSNTLFAGDRAGSRYFFAMEPVGATATSNFRSGSLNPGFSGSVTACQVNPFAKFNGLEFFGVIERAKGRAATESVDREWDHLSADLIYRFLPKEAMYVAGRYNTAKGQLAGIASDVSADRYQLGLGWFLTPNILTKGEYVNQSYKNFPVGNINHKGRFSGFMVEGVIAF
jgi:hypothetical protein